MKLIDKAALVAEIEKLRGKISDSSSYCNGWQHALRMLELSLDTLEVKEVDLEKEVEMEMKRFAGNLTCREECHKFAKHFFELGMAVSNKQIKEKDV